MKTKTRHDQPIKHGRQKHRGATAAVVKGLAISLAIVLVSTASVGAWLYYDITSNVASNAVDINQPGDTAAPPPPPGIAAIEGGFNMLVVGADNDENQGREYGKRDGTLNDVNMLLHVSADHTQATVVSFPRDLVVPQPKCVDPVSGTTSGAVSAQPLNSAYGRGGLACVNATIEQLTGLDIRYAAELSFNAVVQMTDAVGGVPVCLTAPIKDKYSGLNLPAGTTVISGPTALAFLRTRHGVGDGSDLSRIASQQQYISSLVRTIKSSDTLTDVGKLYSLAQVASKSVKLSTDLANINVMVSMARTLQTIDLDKLNLIQYPVGASSSDPNKVAPKKAIATQLFEKLAADEPFAVDTSVDRNGVEADPNAPPSAAPPADPAVPSAPGATDAPVATTPSVEVIEGLSGQTAQDQTCSVANR